MELFSKPSLGQFTPVKDPSWPQSLTIIDLEKNRVRVNCPADRTLGQNLLFQGLAQAVAENKRLQVGRGDWYPTDSISPYSGNGFVQIEGEGDGQTVIFNDDLATKVTLFHVRGRLWNADTPEDAVATGVPSSGIPTLTAAAAAGSHVLTLSSTAGLADGNIIKIRDPSQAVINPLNGGVAACNGQHVRIKHLGTRTTYDGTVSDSETKITLWGATEFDYLIGTTIRLNDVEKGPIVSNLTFQRANPILAGEAGTGIDDNGTPRAPIPGPVFSLYNVRDTRFEGVRFVGMDSTCIRVSGGFDGMIDNLVGEDIASQNNENAPYLVYLTEGTTGFALNNIRALRVRHAVDFLGNSDIESAHHIVNNLVARECAFAGVDTHPGARHITFNNCQVWASDRRYGGYPPGSGIQDRGRFNVHNNPMVVGCDAGIAFTHGYNCTLNGGTFDQCRVGIAINNAPQTRIVGNIVIRNPREDVITLRRDRAPMMPDIRIGANIDVEGAPSGYVINNYTTWDDSWDIARGERIYAPDVVSKYNNVPAYATGDVTKPNVAKFQNFDRGSASSLALAALSSGQLKMTAIFLPRGEVISKIGIVAAATGVNPANFWMALYDRNRNRLRVTNDLGTTNPTVGALTQLDLETPYRTTYEGLYYIGVVSVASTPPTVYGRTGQSTLGNFTPIRNGTTGSGLTDPTSAPNPAAPLAGAINQPYHTLA